MDALGLMEALNKNSMARLRHAVLKKVGIPPFSLRAVLISDRQILRYACHLALDAEQAEEFSSGGFDMKRFQEMKEGRHGAV